MSSVAYQPRDVQEPGGVPGAGEGRDCGLFREAEAVVGEEEMESLVELRQLSKGRAWNFSKPMLLFTGHFLT